MKSNKVSGVLIVDKPSGLSSHDVVSRVRRRLGTRKVGHAGTLDPLASGVLVVLVGEGTKLGAYLTAHTKRYLARVAFGLSTETLDREGAPTASAEVPAWLAQELSALAVDPSASLADAWPRLAAALAAERTRSAQMPPAYSAIKVGGRRSYARARAGEAVALPERPVSVLSLRIAGAGAGFVDLDLEVSKGYYVRSLARDLGAHLDMPSHLEALRRTASGPFTLADAVDLTADPVLIPVPSAAQRSLPWEQLTEAGVQRARRGQPLQSHDFVALPPLDRPSAWLSEAGHLVAIGTRRPDGFMLHRGFVDELAPCPPISGPPFLPLGPKAEGPLR
jgi:tRNA pseudouridine55 synthase